MEIVENMNPREKWHHEIVFGDFLGSRVRRELIELVKNAILVRFRHRLKKAYM